MTTHTVTILDYGMCNLLNVARAFNYVGAEVRVTDDVQIALASDRLVVPGVGAFRDCMKELSERGFNDVIRLFADTGRPLLGICVGMQVLFEGSDEFGDHRGLGIFKGRVCAIPKVNDLGLPHRVPHIGWNKLVRSTARRSWERTILEPLLHVQSEMYFVHSFSARPLDAEDLLADCFYGGHRICASVQKANVMATQFHPERSGESGLAVIRRFVEL